MDTFRTHLNSATRAAIFDIGGVVIEIDFGRAVTYWANAAGIDSAVLSTRFRFDHAYEKHELGQIDASEYFAHLRSALEVDLPDEVLAAGWTSIYVGEVPGVRQILQALAATIPVYGFSNSNRTHRTTCAAMFEEVFQPFRRIFGSFEIGRRKPDPEAFRYVISEVGFRPDEMVFFDDLEENVAVARQLGMNAFVVRGIGDVEKATRALLH